MAEKCRVTAHVSGRWSQRFRRMRVYNPRATFEQAQLISKLFEKSQKCCRRRRQNRKPVTSAPIQSCNILDLPDYILCKIFNYVIAPEMYKTHPMLERYLFGAVNKLACKALYRLVPVCNRFRNIIYKYHSTFPRPPIGLRLQAPVCRSPNYGGLVVAYIYGDCGKRYFSKCVFIGDVPAAIFPGQICTFLIIKGMVITNHLMDMLLSLDLSKVEEVFWHDIRGSYATNLVEKMKILLLRMSNLCYAEFYSTNNFDPTTLFSNSDCYWSECDLEKVDEYNIPSDEMRNVYRRVKKWRLIRKKRSLRRFLECNFF
ncbi:hypothetical protein DICVIV_09085 [Dictyocaulus viviparus]|uniref:F-box domain protein n=1 Tax=Dictyocaulus viviparus TaxID=29172 RepID=A0A0D8XJY7_DICVI|nr:hypothetical protein DICVIV_09085 [Dictyocaulus viviparus]